MADKFMGLSRACATTVFLNGNVVQLPCKYYVYDYKLLKLSASIRVAQLVRWYKLIHRLLPCQSAKNE